LGGSLVISNSGSEFDALFAIKKQELPYLCEFIQESGSPESDFSNLISREKRHGMPFLVGDRVYQRTHKPFLMGILNVTPDSFSDGGQFFDPIRAVEHAHRMIEEGADFLDIGGESSRPGSDSVSAEEEIGRVIPVIKALRGKIDVPMSIDTTKADVAERALGAGASIVNDISAMQWDERMPEVIRRSGATVVLMHMKGEPKSMQTDPHYDDLMGEIHGFLAARVEVALQAGIERERIFIDPGIGFGKRVGDNFEILGRLRELGNLGPILVGPSRKSFIGYTLDVPADKRLSGTAGAVAVAALHDADVIRIHDVKEMSHVVEIASRCMYDTGR
jgi:dihydropteroate synthase